MAAASGATEAYRRRRALRSLWSGDENSPIRLVVTRGAQPPQAVVAERTRSPAQTQETRPAAIEEIEAGVLYLDVDRLEASDIPRIRSRIDGASGIVIDVRGYPRHNMFLVQGLMTQEADSPQWCVPVPVRPHQQDMEFEQQGWTLAATKRWRAKTVFLTDDRAISYAETYLSFVEQHQLAPIVGTTTAGTNGNINRLALPGGYEMVWTGMKTRKPDGSPPSRGGNSADGGGGADAARGFGRGRRSPGERAGVGTAAAFADGRDPSGGRRRCRGGRGLDQGSMSRS